MTTTAERAAEARKNHEASTTERQRAEIEAVFLADLRRFSPDLLAGKPYSAVVAHLLGLPMGAVRNRQHLTSLGDVTDPLWDLIDNGDLTISTAVLLVRRAKEIKVSPETTAAAVRRAIAEYYARPFSKSLSSGKVIRFNGVSPKAPGSPVPPLAPARRQNKPPPEPERHVPDAPKPAAQPAAAATQPQQDDLWARIREMCADYARKRLPDYEAEQIAPELQRLDTDLKIVFEQFADRIRTKRRETPLKVVITRRQVTEACRTLLIDPPKEVTKIPASFFLKAHRQFKILAREYHPDTNGGGEAARPRFEAVMASWRVLQTFQETDPGRGQ